MNKETLEYTIREILYDNMSRYCYEEVDDLLINELIETIQTDGSIWTVLNDNLSNVALDELQYETDGLKELYELCS